MFSQMKLGCLKPKEDNRTLRLAKYLAPAQLPQAPAQVDYDAKVASWPMMGNDQYGDCTIAAAAHMQQLWSTVNGSPVVPSDQDVVSQYMALTGGADNGLALLDVMNAWRQNGLCGNKIGAYAAVNLADHAEVAAAIWLFGAIITGVQLPLAWQGTTQWQAPGRHYLFGWTPWARAWGKGSWGGHAVPIGSYSATGLKPISWGQEVSLSWAAWDTYFVEAYVAIDPLWVDGTKPAPSGFDIAALNADLQAIGAN